MKKIIIIFLILSSFYFIGYFIFSEKNTEKLKLVNSKEIIKIEKQTEHIYQKNQKVFVARILKQDAGTSPADWFVWNTEEKFLKDTVFKNILFERGDAWPDENPLTHGDIEVRLAVVQ